jgi:hypothetical protein
MPCSVCGQSGHNARTCPRRAGHRHQGTTGAGASQSAYARLRASLEANPTRRHEERQLADVRRAGREGRHIERVITFPEIYNAPPVSSQRVSIQDFIQPIHDPRTQTEVRHYLPWNNDTYEQLVDVPNGCALRIRFFCPEWRLPMTAMNIMRWGREGQQDDDDEDFDDVLDESFRASVDNRATPTATHDKKKTPKHIAEQIWELNEPDCQICLDKIDKEVYVLSQCGHNFCKSCFEDTRLTKCGECRVDL